MSQQLIDEITAQYVKSDVPELRPGDTVRVSVKIIENEKTIRQQVYEGLIIAIEGHGVSETFTVRKMSYGIGVERTFAVNSPRIASIEVVKHGKVRRAKLNYVRNLSAKESRITERRALNTTTTKDSK